MCSWTSGESLVGSLSAPDEHEPIDFFGHGGFLIDCVAMGPQRGHPLRQIVVGLYREGNRLTGAAVADKG
jgi:hypothetical protein